MTDQLPSIADLLAKQGQSSAPSAADDVVTTSTSPEPTEEEQIHVTGEKSEEALDDRLSQIGFAGKEREIEQQAAMRGLPYIDLKGFPISPDAITQLDKEEALELKAICFLYNGTELRLGAVDPMLQTIKDKLDVLAKRTKANVALYQISQRSFTEALKVYEKLPKVRKIVKGVQIKAEELDRYQAQMETFADIANVLEQAKITDVLAVIVAASLKLKTSDIHIEAEEKGVAVRFRVDGILQEITTLPREHWKKIVSRIKLIAGLKINITDRPQDGRFTIFQQNKKIDVRTSTMPTAWGESVVMRILNPDSIQLEFVDLGFREAAFKRLEKEITKPHGMIITTGPTGSGKTTTLYAILKRLNQPGVKIITLEDPVEYKLEGINQSQMDRSKEYTFAKGLRSILRQDPDIVMVGEIRDLETAETAIQAALTGHLLLSTIHTNDAAGAIPRFISMGVKPFLLAPAVNAIMGQRLLRRLCQECKKPADIPSEKLEAVKAQLLAIPDNSGETVPDLTGTQFFGPGGCEACNDTGYRGRVGVYEILIKNAEIEQFILSGEVSEYKTREIAAKQGMVSMTQDALLKALDGLTSIEEVERVTGLE